MAALPISAPDAADEAERAEPYPTLDAAHRASGFGMWIFIASEVLFFGALFGGYTSVRLAHGPAFAAASRHTDLVLGTINTALLLTSSVTMAAAGRTAARSPRATRWFLIATIVLGAAFLGVKGLEYAKDFADGLVPGPEFRPTGPDAHGMALFFWIYFASTGLHAVHLTIGIVLVGVTARLIAAEAPDDGERRVEIVALYWHLVDLVWIFLFPMLYLVQRT